MKEDLSSLSFSIESVLICLIVCSVLSTLYPSSFVCFYKRDVDSFDSFRLLSQNLCANSCLIESKVKDFLCRYQFYLNLRTVLFSNDFCSSNILSS